MWMSRVADEWRTKQKKVWTNITISFKTIKGFLECTGSWLEFLAGSRVGSISQIVKGWFLLWEIRAWSVRGKVPQFGYKPAPNIFPSKTRARISDTHPSLWEELQRKKRYTSKRKKYKKERDRDQFLGIYYNLYAASLTFALPHMHACSNTQESPDEWPKHRDYSQLVGSQKAPCPVYSSSILPSDAAAIVKGI